MYVLQFYLGSGQIVSESTTEISKFASLEQKQVIKQEIIEVIKKVGDEYAVYPKKGGKRLGTHKTKEKAIAQLKAIEASKRG